MTVFLSSGERRPRLRLLDWTIGTEQPLAGAPDWVAGNAMVRDGWFVFGCSGALALTITDGVSAWTKIPGGHPAPHQDPKLVWTTGADGTARAYDRFGRTSGAGIAVPTGWLKAAYDDAWLQWDPTTSNTTLHRRDQVIRLGRWMAMAAAGPHVLLMPTGLGRKAAVLDLRDGSRRPVKRKGFSVWDNLCSVSPDGRTVAVSAQVTEPLIMPTGMPLAERLEWISARKVSDDTRVMTLIDFATAVCTVVEGGFRNFAFDPAWMADSTAVVFGIPFARGMIGHVELGSLQLERRVLAKNIGMPLVDVTAHL